MHSGHLAASCPYPSYSLKDSKHTGIPPTPGHRTAFGSRLTLPREVRVNPRLGSLLEGVGYSPAGKFGITERWARLGREPGERCTAGPGMARGAAGIPGVCRGLRSHAGQQHLSSRNHLLQRPTARRSLLMFKQLPSLLLHTPYPAMPKKKPQPRIVLQNSPPTWQWKVTGNHKTARKDEIWDQKICPPAGHRGLPGLTNDLASVSPLNKLISRT